MTHDEWLALAKQCEEAKGPDMDLDDAIWWPLCLQMPDRYRVNAFGDRETNVMSIAGGQDWRLLSSYERALCYTYSLNAITALIERELQGGSWLVASGRTRPDEPLGGARIFADEAGDHCIGEAEAATPALALCAAFCRAMAEKAG